MIQLRRAEARPRRASVATTPKTWVPIESREYDFGDVQAEAAWSSVHSNVTAPEAPCAENANVASVDVTVPDGPLLMLTPSPRVEPLARDPPAIAIPTTSSTSVDLQCMRFMTVPPLFAFRFTWRRSAGS